MQIVSANPDAIHTAAAKLAEKRNTLEVGLMVEIFHSPARTIPLARAVGIDRDSFASDDLRIIFLACEMACDEGLDRDTLFRFIENVLRQHNLWDPKAGFAPPFGPRWCAENLHILAAGYFCPTAIKYLAAQLYNVIRRQRSARALTARKPATFGGSMKPALRITPAPADAIENNSPRKLAEAFLQTRSEISHFRSEFYIRERCVYVRMEREELRATLADWLARQIVLDESARPAPYRPNTRRVNDVLDAIANITQVHGCKTMPAWLDGGKHRPNAANVLAFYNGIIDVAEFVAGNVRLMPPIPEWFSVTVLPFNFDERAPTPAMWWKFLAELWPEDDEAIALLQEWFGYCLSADTSQQKILLLAGPPRSGKGTVVRILEKLIGADNVAGPTLAGLASNFGLASLIGKPLATIADARLSGRTDQAIVTERLLSISGEDSLTIDRKNRDAVTQRLPTRLMLLSNELPKLSDASGALAERFLILSIKRSFLGSEDTELTNKLATELPGILLWALDGLKRLRTRGRFVMPASGNEAMEELRELVSPIKTFVNERCIVGPGQQALASRLFEAWKTWCNEQGREHPGTLQTFGRDLRAALPAIGMSRPTIDGDRQRLYEGIGLNYPGLT